MNNTLLLAGDEGHLNPAISIGRSYAWISATTYGCLRGPVGLYQWTATYRAMAGFGHFNIPADDVGRAKKFYESLLGWKIQKDELLENRSLEWHTVITGGPEKGVMNHGGLFRRYVPGQIINFIILDDFDRVYTRVGECGGTIVMPKNEINRVGTVAVIQDTEGNVFGLLRRTTG